MTIWRSKQAICVKAIGLPFRRGCVFAAEITDDIGRIKGVRPLGGHVEFEEHWADTITREFREELDIDVRVDTAPLVFENIYTHEGQTGHEYVYAARVSLHDGDLMEETVTFAEDNGLSVTARWSDLQTLDTPRGYPLFPRSLGAQLAEINP
ncbi:MAG: NUDIX domain-containing protein [Pseudomonadota bacterium]